MNELVWSINVMILTVEHGVTWSACPTLTSSAPLSLRPPKIPKSLPHSHFVHQKSRRTWPTLTSSTKNPEEPDPLSIRPPKIPKSLPHSHFVHQKSRRTWPTLTSSTKNPTGSETRSHDWRQIICYAFLANVRIINITFFYDMSPC